MAKRRAEGRDDQTLLAISVDKMYARVCEASREINDPFRRSCLERELTGITGINFSPNVTVSYLFYSFFVLLQAYRVVFKKRALRDHR